MMRLQRILPVVLVLAMVPVTATAQGQDTWNAGQFYATRAQLQDMLSKYESGSNASAYSDAVRSIAGDEADLIRTRLEKGDFEVGDVITLQVAGQVSLTQDFTVAPGYILVLPEIEEPVQLRGVLRSELRDVITEHLANYLRDPRVYVQTKVSIQVWGDVGSPGYKMVSADSRLTDVLAVDAGQPNATAKMDKLKIKRGDETIWEGDELELAIVQGRTLDQLNLRAGDSIEVPGQTTRSWGAIIRSMYYLVPLSLAISRIF
jgi:protein involved in polysaccharide export with SLBB domain